MKLALGLAFALGLAGLVLCGLGYVLGTPQTGHVFVASLALVFGSALLTALRREEGARTEDIITMLIACCAIGWLAWHSFR